MDVKTWLKALRLPFLTATIVPVVLGSIIAWHITSQFSWTYFWLALVAVACLQLGTNLANDYFDHKSKNDDFNLTPTPFSGGSRVIQEGLIPAKNILYASLIFFILGTLIGVYLSWNLNTYVILLLGLTGAFCGFFYTAGPFKFGYRGIGEFFVGLCFGPLVVLGSYYVQTQSFSISALLASIPIGILISLVLYINEFPDYLADKKASKKTLVVLLGKEKAIKLYHFLLFFVFFYIIFSIVLKLIPAYSLITLVALPLALKAYSISKNNFDKIKELIPANASTIMLHLAFGLLLSLGFALDKIL